jgi:DNA-directed RNA polymerase subunit RPC12/RpoP
MKTRLGFVSNSSSTSFYCPICNREFSGWDWDEDPVCPNCGIHIRKITQSLNEYICEKYNLNLEEEINNYKEKCKYEN